MMGQEAESILGVLVSTDSEAVRLRSGDLDALAVLMERYQHRLYRYLLRLVSQQSTAEDLSDLAALWNVFKNTIRSNFEMAFVAHNLAIDIRGSNKNLDRSFFRRATVDRTQSDDAGWISLCPGRRIGQGAVSDLPVSFREVIALRFEEEMKLEEIATTLALPVGTVKTRLHRALKALRQSMQEQPKIENTP
jgi:RNA polymerase sigma-70 factor (ECF subfamily)